MMEKKEKYLLGKIKNGDETAFKVIYNKYVPRLYYFIYEYIPLPDIAENIIQETLMVLWEKKNSLQNGTNLGAYLFTVAKNNCLYKLRQQRYQNKLIDTKEISQLEINANIDALDTLDTSLLAFKEIESIIEETLSLLPPQCRKVFELSRFEEKKNSEIAEELGISVKAVEGHMTKALKLFRSALKDYLPIVAFLLVR